MPARFMIVPQQVLKVDGLNRIPDNVGHDEASAAEPFACAINAQELLGIEEGDTVVVFGAGPIGCMHIRIAWGVHKAGRIALIDVNTERLKMSADAVEPDEIINGAEVDVFAKVMELTGGRGVDVVITATAANVTCAPRHRQDAVRRTADAPPPPSHGVAREDGGGGRNVS